MQHLPPALGPLGAHRQFMLYKLVPSRTRPGKTDKFPMTVAGEVVDAHDSNHWVTADEAITAASMWGDGHGVAFVFTANDPFFFVDIDNAAEAGAWSQTAQSLLSQFPGAAVELSQSGTGLHIIGSYAGAEPIHGCKNIPLNLELYTSGRFVALTGNQAMGNAATDCTAALSGVISHYFPESNTARADATWTTHHVAGSYPIQDDDALIQKALETEGAASAFGGGVSFKDLWTGNVEALAQRYPDTSGEGKAFDASSADAALASHLVFWTGGNCDRIDRLMRRSALVRDKWDQHKGYMHMTVGGACAAHTGGYYDKGKPLELVDASTVDETPVLRTGAQFMPPEQQATYFKGCVYIAENNRIFTPNGVMMKQEQFNAMYGGYLFIMDSEGEKTTKKAWEVFTESQAMMFPKADRFTFKPDTPTGSITTDEGFRYVNTYVPVDIASTPGDVSPFLDHLRKLLPDERDQVILLSYMAACIQHKGVKFQWAPLIQGVEGNGKTLFTRCVAYAIGERYTHMPPANEISEKFNAWLFNMLFIGVEDIYVPHEKREVIEILKPMITNDRLARRAMQTDQVMHNVCANFMFNSNYKDAIKKTLNDRRYCVFYTAQQESADITRDGMAGEYFPWLYGWLKSGGYAHVAHYLETFAIPEEFNPATTCQRAPVTSSTEEAVRVGMGSVEQEIIEAIDEGRYGFAGGWVSSFMLDQLIENMRKSNQVPRNKRRDLMKSIGYDWHPGLKDGRVNNPIPNEGGKPRLFIKSGHIHTNLTAPVEIARHYQAAQGEVTSAGQIFGQQHY